MSRNQKAGRELDRLGERITPFGGGTAKFNHRRHFSMQITILHQNCCCFHCRWRRTRSHHSSRPTGCRDVHVTFALGIRPPTCMITLQGIIMPSESDLRGNATLYIKGVKTRMGEQGKSEPATPKKMGWGPPAGAVGAAQPPPPGLASAAHPQGAARHA